MARVRRTRYVFFFCDDQPLPDIGLLLRGTAEAVTHRQLYAIAILTGREVPMTAEDLEFVLELPSSDWADLRVEESGRARDLARNGVLLMDDDADAELARLRALDEHLASADWNLYGALYHFLTRWRGFDLRDYAESDDARAEIEPPTTESLGAFFDLRGRPPAAFHSVGAEPALELPVITRRGPLYDLLRARKTTRSFTRESPMSLEALAVVLRYVFGCHGYARVLDEVVTLKKTSPSGGGLHPVEVYPLVARVEGVAPGLYHYSTRDHALEPVQLLSGDEAAELGARFVSGQTYLASAQVLFVLTARFERANWKYMRHQKGYALMLMDAAHLSQTLYLVSTDLGLGAWFTAAINNADIDERLGIDGCGEGSIAVCGCGQPAAERSPFDPEFLPYVPRETAL
jgi:putative peptide maturation dehydrogenase